MVFEWIHLLHKRDVYVAEEQGLDPHEAIIDVLHRHMHIPALLDCEDDWSANPSPPSAARPSNPDLSAAVGQTIQRPPIRRHVSFPPNAAHKPRLQSSDYRITTATDSPTSYPRTAPTSHIPTGLGGIESAKGGEPSEDSSSEDSRIEDSSSENEDETVNQGYERDVRIRDQFVCANYAKNGQNMKINVFSILYLQTRTRIGPN